MHVGHRPRGLNLVYFSVELWRVLDGTMHHSPFRRRWTGGTAAVNGMEERDRVDASTNLCSQPGAATGRRHLRPRPVDANRLCCFIFVTQSVAVTGRKHLRPRPVDFVILFSVLDPWLLLAGGNSILARLILLSYLFSLLNLWLLLAEGISAIARLDSFIFAELLYDYCCLLLELLCAVCFGFMLI